MEIKRILYNKTILLTALALIFINIAFYVKEQADELGINFVQIYKVKEIKRDLYNQIKEKNLGENWSLLNRIVAEVEPIVRYDSLMKMGLYSEENSENYQYIFQELLEGNPNLLEQYEQIINTGTIVDFRIQYSEVMSLQNTVQYVKTYQDKINSIKERKKQSEDIGIFSEKNLFTTRNIQKTWNDYFPLLGVELELGNDSFIESIVRYKLPSYLIFLFLIVVVMNMLKDQRSNLSLVIFSTLRGRSWLAFIRMGSLFVIVSLYTLLMYGMLFLLSAMIYGMDNLSRYIQSIPLFFSWTLPLREWEFIVLYIIILILTFFLMSLVIWLIASVIKSKSAIVSILFLVVGMEYIVYQSQTDISRLTLFRYLNIYFLFDISKLFTMYLNINFFNYLIDVQDAVLCFITVGTVLCAVAIIVISAKQYQIRKTLLIERGIHFILLYLRKAVQKFGILGAELYKILMLNKGIYILAGILFISYLNIYSGVERNLLFYSQKEIKYNFFCEEYEGQSLNEEIYNYIASMKIKSTEAQNQLDDNQKVYQQGNISKEAYLENVAKYTAILADASSIDLIENKIDYLERLKAEQGVSGQIINEYGYKKLLADASVNKQIQLAFLILVSVILISTGIFEIENKRGTSYLIKSCILGRQKLYNTKLKVTMLVAIITSVVIYGLQLISVYQQFGLSMFQANIKSVEYMESLPFNCSIGAYFIGLYLFRIIMIIIVAIILMSLSVFLSQVASLIIGIGTCLVPTILYFSGLEIGKTLSYPYFLCLTQILVANNGWKIIVVISLILIIVCGSLVKFARKKWCQIGTYENLEER